MVNAVEVPLYELNWEQGVVSSTPLPEPITMPVEGLGDGGVQTAVAFRDEHNDVITAVLDGQGDWNIGFLRWTEWAQCYRTQITTAVKGFAYALMASGDIAKSEGRQRLGSALRTAGNVVNSTTAFSDVAHYGHSAYKSYQQHRLATPTVKDLGKAGGQLLGLVVGVAAALSPSQSVQAASSLVTFAAIAATGPTQQEEQKAQEEAHRLFYSQPGAHLGSTGVQVGYAQPYGSGTATPHTTTPHATRANTAVPESPVRRFGTSGFSGCAGSNGSSTYEGRPNGGSPERCRGRSGPRQ
ncbi:hypothetical protein [Streptomyces ziwulingensis]|uniref:Uncharacterized protein n=1 Tax=Streptomyces ziwulingensis TaxID=1045501 RepID=A0ABP9B0Q9_9ACTN